jgi:tRNA threonylcarbamoyladenosine biosynthesis protein TsaB
MPEAEPRVLVIETSGRVGQIALARGERLCGTRRLDEARRHVRDLAPAVKDLLAEQAWMPSDIHVVMVSRGPGSYTGLRVGIMSAKAFAYATGSAVLAIDTFAAIAEQAPAHIMRVDVLADAQQGKVYVQEFSRQQANALMESRSALVIRPFAELLEKRAPDAWATGPGLRGHEIDLPARMIASGQWDPQPESLLALGLLRYRRGEQDDVWSLEPLYLRPSAAEQQWQNRKA